MNFRSNGVRSNGVSVKWHLGQMVFGQTVFGQTVFGQMVFQSNGARSKKSVKLLFGKVIQNLHYFFLKFRSSHFLFLCGFSPFSVWSDETDECLFLILTLTSQFYFVHIVVPIKIYKGKFYIQTIKDSEKFPVS
jgi:hypothetical protein